jgi:hypothetical protein
VLSSPKGACDEAAREQLAKVSSVVRVLRDVSDKGHAADDSLISKLSEFEDMENALKALLTAPNNAPSEGSEKKTGVGPAAQAQVSKKEAPGKSSEKEAEPATTTQPTKCQFPVDKANAPPRPAEEYLSDVQRRLRDKRLDAKGCIDVIQAKIAEYERKSNEAPGRDKQNYDQRAVALGRIAESGGETGDADLALPVFDQREFFDASLYTGYAVDTFSGEAVNRYLNPGNHAAPKERFVAGFDFEYRLLHSPDFHQQLWVYGETVHGVRSTDVDCNTDPKPEVCNGLTTAGAGILYLKGEIGFASVAGTDSAFRQEHIAAGLTATSGRFKDSHLEFGYGRNDLFRSPVAGFQDKYKNRWLIDALLSWEQGILKSEKVYPFAQITIDTDLGRGADSIQSYIGLAFDVDQLFHFK